MWTTDGLANARRHAGGGNHLADHMELYTIMQNDSDDEGGLLALKGDNDDNDF